MGEAKFLATLSETSSEKRRLYFGSWASRDLYLGRHSTLGEGSISLRGYDESLFGRDLIFRRPVDFSSRKS